MPPVPAAPSDETEEPDVPELHPLWSAVLVLAEIAERTARGKPDEVATAPPAPSRRPAGVAKGTEE